MRVLIPLLLLGSAHAAQYTVKAGDTLYSLARTSGSDVASLMTSNNLTTPTIQVGQIINLPAGPTPRATPTPAPHQSSVVRTTALRSLGFPYVLGGTSARGIDCSAFVQNTYSALGIRLPRTSAQQAQIGTPVSSRDLREGDLVFFNTTGRGVSHVGIYLSGGQMINANSYAGRVVIEPLFTNPYWKNRYLGARRVS